MKRRLVSHFLFICFWPLAWAFIYAMGEAGSPQPDNWRLLSSLGDAAGHLAVACLVSSVSIGYSLKSENKPLPISSFASGLILIAMPAYFGVRIAIT